MATERIVIIVSENGTDTVIKKINSVGKSSDSAASSVNFLSKALGFLGAAATLKGLTDLLDTYQNIENRLNVVSKTTDEAAAAQQRLFDIANRSRSAFETTAELYSRVVQSTVQLGTSHEQAARVVETLNKAVIVSGASSREAEAALLQLSQGLASGTLRGQELRSVLTQMPVVADLISQKLGITRGALRNFGAEGKITSKIMIDALIGAADQIDEKFAKTAPTLSQSFAVLQNQLLAFIGEINEKYQIIPRLSGFIKDFGASIDTIARSVIAGSFVIAVQKALSIVNALGAALAANPIGAIAIGVIAATAALIAFSDQITLSTESAATLADFFTALFELISANARYAADLMGDSFQFVGDVLRKVFGTDASLSLKGFITLGARAVDSFVGFFLGMRGAIIQVFKDIPATIELIFKGIINGMLKTFEFFINGVILNLNSIANTKIGKTVGLEPLPLVNLGRLSYSKEATDQGDAIGKAFVKGFQDYTGTVDLVQSLFKRADDIAATRLQQQAAKAQALKKGNLELNAPVTPDRSLKDERVVAIEEVIKKLTEEGEALKKNSFERAISMDLIRIEQSLKHKGIELSKEEATQIETKLRENELLKVRAALIDQVDGALENNARQQQVVNDLIQQGVGRVDLYVAKLRQLKIEQLGMERDTASGFQRGFLKVQDEITNFADASEKVVTNAFHGMEDALVDFVTKGKFSFSSLVDSILADLTRLLLRQAISGLLSSFGGGGAFGSIFSSIAGARANGGDVSAGKAYVVGEKGPEIFNPNTSGTIIPNGSVGAPAPQVHVSVVNVSDPEEINRALNHPQNQQQIINVVRQNREAVRTALGIAG